MALGDPREQYRGTDPRGQLAMRVPEGTNRGMVAATPQTQFGPDDTIPQFLQGLVEPYIKQKQNEAFYNGFIAQQAAGVEHEVIDEQSPISKIFGPDGYREGASFYRGSTLVANRVQAYLADTDTLKQMAPEELSKKFAKDSQSLMTGNATTDAVVQTQWLKDMTPTINTILKARIDWQQNNGVNTQSDAMAANAATMQKLSVMQAATTNLSDDDTQASQQARQNFANTLAPPQGQTMESYKRALVLGGRRMMHEGNFYAYEMMRDNPNFYSMVDEKDRAALEADYQREGTRNLDLAHTRLMPQLLALEEKRINGKISPNELTAGYMQLNEAASKMTGIKGIDLIDAKAVEQKGISIIEAVRQTAIRNENRQNELDDKKAQWAHEEQVKAEEADRLDRVAHTVWGTGHINTALAAKQVEPYQMEAMAQSAINTGDMHGLAVAHREGYIASKAAETLQAGVQNSIAEGWTDNTAKAYDQWKALSKEDGGAAAGYYGKYDTAMKAMDGMIVGEKMNPAVAWSRAFGNNALLDQYQLSNEDRKPARTAIDQEVKRIDGAIMGFGGSHLTDSSAAVIGHTLEGFVAMNRKYTSVAVPVLVRQAYDVAKANGTLEHYGRFAWNNPKGTQPMYLATGIQPDAFPKVLNAEVDQRFHDVGIGKVQNYDIVRSGSRIIAMAHGDNGVSKTITFTAKDLEMRKGDMIRKGLMRDDGSDVPMDPMTGMELH